MPEIPTVNWPEERGQYKFVQLDLGDGPYLRFGGNIQKGSGGYHSRILSGFLDEQGIGYELIGNKQKNPALKGSGYTVRGMGSATIDFDGRMAFFGGNSVDYNLGPDKEHLQKIAEKEPEWRFIFF